MRQSNDPILLKELSLLTVAMPLEEQEFFHRATVRLDRQQRKPAYLFT